MAATARTITIDNPPARAVFDPHTGRMDILPASKPSPALVGATCGVTIAGECDLTLTAAQMELLSVECSGESVAASFGHGRLVLKVALSRDARPGAFVIRIDITNNSTAPVPVRALLALASDSRTRLDAGLRPANVKVYRNGWGIQDGRPVTGLAEVHEEPLDNDLFGPARERATVKGLVRSSQMLQVRGARGYLTCGFLEGARQPGVISVGTGEKGRIRFSAAAAAQGKPIRPGRTYAAEPLYISIGDDFAAGLDDFATALGEESTARRFGQRPGVLWLEGSADGMAHEAQCLAGLAFLDAHRHDLDIAVVLVDCWQESAGDMTRRSGAFPARMKALADRISASGFTPGVRLAPFLVDQASQAAGLRPDMIVRDAAGGAIVAIEHGQRRFHVLDLSNPKALSHIAECVERLCREWGYRYLVADFLNTAALSGARHDPTRTDPQNIRRGLEVVRQVAGEDVYISASRCQGGAAAGVVDALGIWPPPDISSDLAEAARALARGWTHGAAWHNTSACVFPPSGQTDRRELATAANIIALSGGAAVMRYGKRGISREALDAAARLFPVPTKAAVPLDLYSGAMPSVYFAAGNPILMGVFNWGAGTAAFKVDTRRITAGLPVSKMRDCRGGCARGLPRGVFTVELKARESRLFAFE